MMFKNKADKGFTLIELLAVIAILAILVLLAAPKMLGYTKDAKLVQIKNDIKAYETAIASEVLDKEDFLDSLKVVNNEDIVQYVEENSLFNKKGLIENEKDLEGSHLEVEREKFNVDSKLKGQFFINEKGLVLYYENNSNVSKNEGSNENSDKDDVYLASDNDFEWVESSDGYTALGQNEKGYYRYKGNKKIVKIPDIINGNPMTSYYRMFYQEGKSVEKVISSNKNVTDMRQMFFRSQSKTLDLSSFDTNKVNDMSDMFNGSQATALDLRSFNTNNVTDMNYMFYLSQAKVIDLSSFNTSNVTDMRNMFRDSKATTLDLHSFDTNNVANMSSMFEGSQAITLDLSSFNTESVVNMGSILKDSRAIEGYARTQGDADKFNTSSNKPESLVFKLKKENSKSFLEESKS